MSISLALLAGAALRIWMYQKFFLANGDTLVYGDIARNLLQHGQYALGTAQPAATLIRLPGYPLFLAACFSLFGVGNYGAVVAVQTALELAGCLLLAEFARRSVPAGRGTAAAQGALWLAALCPFTAVYAASVLAETPTLFALALAMWAAIRFVRRPGWGAGLAFTAGVTWAALLRPDGVLALVLLPPVAMAGMRAGQASAMERRRMARIAVVCVALALAPFAAWTARNWRVFHVVEPLAPRSAADPGEPVYPGWERWVRTWMLDFNSTYQIYWNVPGDELDTAKLPERAFDSPAQREETAALAAEYNANRRQLTPALDAGFARLAAERVAAHPLRYHVGLPLGRAADMWLRPRVGNLNIDLDWWAYSHHHNETEFSWFYAGLNALYLLLAAAGLWLRPRMGAWLLAYMALRSVALAATVTAPEARYTLECFPMLFVLGGVALGEAWRRMTMSVMKRRPAPA
ncbi:MAG TPA: glycosyltransferase family 39 protein [Terracidiphilus sp.]|nr:glycosyltransferase family 39 protein [Terracidiphilus sp.]